MSEPLKLFDYKSLALKQKRSTEGFSDHDFLHQRAAEDVADRLDLIQRNFESVTHITSPLFSIGKFLETHPVAQKIKSQKEIFLDADENLGLKPQSQSLITSLLALHTINDLPGVMAQIRRALKPDGLFIGTLFGGDTLTELRHAFLAAESELEEGVSPRVAPFATVQDMGGLLQRAGFTLPVVDTDVVTVNYEHPLKLMGELRGMAETNILRERRKNFTRRTTLMRACELYIEKLQLKNGRVPATFEIITVTGWAPHESQQKPLKPGSGQTNLADVFKQKDV